MRPVRFHARATRQRGVALLVALLVVALATILIASLLDRGELSAARTRNQLRLAQAQSYAQGLEIYAARVLRQASLNNPPDTSGSMWAIPLPPTPVPGGEIQATMRDRNGCFNLNNLVSVDGIPDPIWHGKFELVLGALKLDPKLADALTNWITSQQSADDGFYLNQPVPYRAGKHFMAHVSELRLIKGVNGDTYTTLAPHVCALPTGTLININTASVPVLRSLDANVTDEMAKRMWQEGHANFRSVSDAMSGLADFKIQNQDHYSVMSTYFQARADITLDGLPFTFFSLIEFGNANGAGAAGGIRVIQRSRGADD